MTSTSDSSSPSGAGPLVARSTPSIRAPFLRRWPKKFHEIGSPGRRVDLTPRSDSLLAMLKLLRAGTAEATALLDRSTRMAGDIDQRVAQTLADVRSRGDQAVAEYTRRFDTREPHDGSYEISRARRD